MEIVRLRTVEYRLLAARFAEHGNSFRRMADALAEAGAAGPLRRLRALRRLERRLEIDLGSLCHRFLRRGTSTHPIERMILGYVAVWGRVGSGGRELWVLVDRVRQVRRLIEQGRLVGEPEP